MRIKIASIILLLVLRFYDMVVFFQKVEVPIFHVLSVDEQWCLKNLKNESSNVQIRIVQGNDGPTDMALLSKMDIVILSSSASTFSWWGAYLNSKARVILYDKIIAQPGSPLDLETKIEDYIPRDWQGMDIESDRRLLGRN